MISNTHTHTHTRLLILAWVWPLTSAPLAVDKGLQRGCAWERQKHNSILSLSTVISTCKKVHLMLFVTGRGKGIDFLLVPALVGDPSPFSIVTTQICTRHMELLAPPRTKLYVFFGPQHSEPRYFCDNTVCCFHCWRKLWKVPQNYIFTFTGNIVRSVCLYKTATVKREFWIQWKCTDIKTQSIW